MRPSRRSLLVGGAATGAFLASPPARAAAKKRVAAIVTEYRHLSHADVICGRILEGYSPNAVARAPRTHIVSMYTDQVPKNDLSRELAQKHGFPIFPTVEEALTAVVEPRAARPGPFGPTRAGTEKLAVDAVLLVGEHGDYPTNEKGQKLYPRHELFQRITAVFRKNRRAVPLFCDKHLSYSWPKAKAMYDEARTLGFPLMAGSSIPLTVRRPPVDVPLGAPLEAAVGVFYGGVEAYGFHGLEAVQSLVERRRGGEVGVRAVECLAGEAVWRWRASDTGRWTAPLLEAALATVPTRLKGKPEEVKDPHLFLVEYRDGFRAALYHLEGHARDFLFAGRLKGQSAPLATCFGDPAGRELKHFDGLVDCIEEMFVSGRPVYPVERTLLTTGALAFLMDSRFQKKRLETPELAIAYKPPTRAYTQTA